MCVVCPPVFRRHVCQTCMILISPPAAFWGDIALDEEDLRMFQDLRDHEQNSVHTADVDSGINSTDPPAQVWLTLTRALLFQAKVEASGGGEPPRSSCDGAELPPPGLSECGPTASSLT